MESIKEKTEVQWNGVRVIDGAVFVEDFRLRPAEDQDWDDDVLRVICPFTEVLAMVRVAPCSPAVELIFDSEHDGAGVPAGMPFDEARIKVDEAGAALVGEFNIWPKFWGGLFSADFWIQGVAKQMRSARNVISNWEIVSEDFSDDNCKRLTVEHLLKTGEKYLDEINRAIRDFRIVILRAEIGLLGRVAADLGKDLTSIARMG